MAGREIDRQSGDEYLDENWRYWPGLREDLTHAVEEAIKAGQEYAEKYYESSGGLVSRPEILPPKVMCEVAQHAFTSGHRVGLKDQSREYEKKKEFDSFWGVDPLGDDFSI